MQLTSYWTDTAPAFDGAADEFGRQYDVAIVGGGFTGLSAARHLAKAGKRVAVLEARRVGNGASGRNGGHLNNGMAHGFAAFAQRFGADRAKALYHLYDASIDFIEALVSEEKITCDFRRSGKLKFASKLAHVASLRESFDLIHKEVDQDTAFIDKSDLGDELISEAAHAAMLYRKSAMMHMGRYLAGLAGAAAGHGADIFEDTPVTGRILENGYWRLETSKGEVRAKDLIVATGGYSGQYGSAFGEFTRRFVPIGSFILATRPMTEAEIAATMPGRRTYVNTLNVGSYFRLSPDNRLIFGGRARFSAKSDPRSDTASGQILRRTMEKMFPVLRNIEADYCFGGLVDMTRDRLPRAGQMGGAWYAMGFSGHGAQLSSLMGARLADCILNRGENPLDFLDWPAIPGHLGKPWFLPATGLYFRLKDLVA